MPFSAALLQNVQDNLASWPYLWPELLLVITLGAILVLALLWPEAAAAWLRPTAVAGLLCVLYSQCQRLQSLEASTSPILCNQLLVLDPWALRCCLVLTGITLLLLLLAPAATQPVWHPEQALLILGTLLASCMLTMAHHWLIVYVALTLMSITSSLLIVSAATPHSAEAGLKYLLYSMALTALMLVGIAYLYGFTHTFVMSLEAWQTQLQGVPAPVRWTLFLFAFSPLFFLLGAVPFHFVLPDVYEGASAAVVAYLSTVPRLAAVALLLQLAAPCLQPTGAAWAAHASHGLGVLALLTIVTGNVAALGQTHLQRLLAYAALAHGGLLLAGLAALPTASPLGVVYYSAVYGIMGFAVWLGTKLLQPLVHGAHLSHYQGLGRQFPVLGVCITGVMLALIGLPPTAGFTGKWFLLIMLWEHWQATQSSLGGLLLLVSLLSTVLSLYYYLRLPYILFSKAEQPLVVQARPRKGELLLLACLTLLLFGGFFVASSLWDLLAIAGPGTHESTGH